MKTKKLLTITTFISFTLWLFASSNNSISMSLFKSPAARLDNSFSGIAKVTDGDTIRIENKRIRLIGIDAPESSQMCFDANYNEYNCGIASKNFLKDLVDEKEVQCYYEKLDKYSRYLCECYIGDIIINQEILKNGMAVTYFFGNENYEMIRLEQEAKEKKIGIWQGAFQLPKDYRKTHKRPIHPTSQ